MTQAPAIVLSDQFFGQARAVVDRPADLVFAGQRSTAPANSPDYKRYALTESGVSPMAIPGTPGTAYTADGLEHAESGTPSSQTTDHLAQLDKRQRKLDSIDYGHYWAEVEGEGELAVVTFGSCTAPVREAFARARKDGFKARLISMRLLLPAQTARLAKALAGVKRVLVVEQTHSKQFYRYLRSEYELPGSISSYSRPGPLPMRPAEIVGHLEKWSRA